MIANNVNMKEISLFGNQIHSRQISSTLYLLCNNTLFLKKVDIGNNNTITKDDVENLVAKQSGVENLYIRLYRFDFLSACKLIKSLITNISLREIDIGYCSISFDVFRSL